MRTTRNRERGAYVYFLTNRCDSVIYIGVTNDLLRRVAEHKLGMGGFTARYRCTKLVYFEAGDSISDAVAREKQLKNWRRAWKNRLVSESNPGWVDLGPRIGLSAELLARIATDSAFGGEEDAPASCREDRSAVS